MKIGEMAEAPKTQAETIRYYEREGLVPVRARTESSYLSYGRSTSGCSSPLKPLTGHAARRDPGVAAVQEDPTGNCVAVNELIDEQEGHVAKRIRELKRLQ